MTAAQPKSWTGLILATGSHPIKLHKWRRAQPDCLTLYCMPQSRPLIPVWWPSRHAGTAFGTETQGGYWHWSSGRISHMGGSSCARPAAKCVCYQLKTHVRFTNIYSDFTGQCGALKERGPVPKIQIRNSILLTLNQKVSHWHAPYRLTCILDCWSEKNKQFEDVPVTGLCYVVWVSFWGMTGSQCYHSNKNNCGVSVCGRRGLEELQNKRNTHVSSPAVAVGGSKV